MKKRMWIASIAALLILTAPVSALATEQADKGKTIQKHNFEQWQTIKRLQIYSLIERN